MSQEMISGAAAASTPLEVPRLRVLVACEFSGTVRDAFIALGHDAVSCDLLPTEAPGPHMQGDVLTLLDDSWDLMIAHPPCTYLSLAGARWWNQPGRAELADRAAEFVFALRDAPIHHIAIENPRGQLNKRWRYPDQVIEPWMFGHPYTKSTGLWLKNLPPLMSTVICAERTPFLPSNTGAGRRSGKPWAKGVAGRGKERSRFWPGIAAAMAVQWGAFIRAAGVSAGSAASGAPQEDVA